LQDPLEVRCDFFHFNDENLRDTVGDLVEVEKVFNAFRIAHNNPHNGGIGRILRIQCDHLDIIRVQQFHYLEQCSNPVLEEDRELFHRWT
jgi:hypothetical protein